MQELQDFERLKEADKKKLEEDRRRLKRDKLLLEKTSQKSQAQEKGERLAGTSVLLSYSCALVHL